MLSLGNNDHEEALGLYYLHFQNELFATFNTISNLQSCSIQRSRYAAAIASVVVFYLWKTNYENQCSHVVSVLKIPG